MLDYTPRWFRQGYGWSYLLLVRHAPWVWMVSYELLEHGLIYRCVQPLRRWWNVRMTRRFLQMLRAAPPDAVLVTHFLPADVCSAAKRAGWLRAPLIAVVTDFHPHRFWIAPEPEAMVINTQEGAQVLTRRGVAPERIHIHGIPIARAFGTAMPRASLQERFGLHPDRRTVLVTSGGTTVGQFERVVESLTALEADLPGRMQLLVVCGEDEGARRRLSEYANTNRMPMQVFGFVDFMADLMAASDLVVAKAGGLTVSEALGRALPLVLYHVIPGQERMNAEYTARHGAAVIAYQPRAVAEAVRRFLEEPRHAAAMQAAARALSHPEAADRIVSEVLQPLLKSAS